MKLDLVPIRAPTSRVDNQYMIMVLVQELKTWLLIKEKLGVYGNHAKECTKRFLK